MMDPLRFCLAIGPVAVYLLLLGAVNLSRRPRLVSGVRDAAALALAAAGLAIVGPLELLFPFGPLSLLFPFESALRSGPYVWLGLTAMYGMCVVLWLLVLRPRLVIYNLSADKLRPVLAELAGRLDPAARWAGDCLSLPALGVQLYVDSFASLGSISLCSAGGNQSRAGWRRLETALGLGSPPRGSRPQPPRTDVPGRRPGVRHGDRLGHLARPAGGGPIRLRRFPGPAEDDWAGGGGEMTK